MAAPKLAEAAALDPHEVAVRGGGGGERAVATDVGDAAPPWSTREGAAWPLEHPADS